MKLDLSRWNPFRFLRKSADDKNNTTEIPVQRSTASYPAPTALPVQAGGFWPDNDMHQLMNQLWNSPMGGFDALEKWFGDFSARVFNPKVDVVDEGNALKITAELPGLDKQDVQLEIESNALILRGEKRQENKSEEKGCYRVERTFGSFQRVLPLPDGLDLDHVKAQFDKGVLSVTLPKLEDNIPASRRIEIQ